MRLQLPAFTGNPFPFVRTGGAVMRTLCALPASGAVLVLAIYFLSHCPAVYAQNDPDDPRAVQILKGDVSVKHGKAIIPFFPPFVKAPACTLTEGTVVINSAEFIELKNIKGKRLHYECKGLKRDEGETRESGSRAMQLVRQGIYPQEGQAEMLFAQSQHEIVARDTGRTQRAPEKFTRMEEYQS